MEHFNISLLYVGSISIPTIISSVSPLYYSIKIQHKKCIFNIRVFIFNYLCNSLSHNICDSLDCIGFVDYS